LEGIRWRVGLCVVALTTGCSAFAAPPDHEQDFAPPLENSAPIIVTGSRIPRTDLTAVSPVTTVHGDDFVLQGTTNVEELLNWLPQVNPSQGELAPPGATGAATIDLRGLGAVRTLVLVNGRRLMPGDPRYPVPDVNSIPAPLIQRVEVLTGGAAAVYGSDAVAGVVNFILDTKLNGFKVEAQISGYQHDNRDKFARELLDRKQFPYPKGSVLDGLRQNVSIAFGRSFLDDRAHLSIYGGYRSIGGVTQDQRDYGACPITARILGGSPSSTLECGGPNVSYPGNFFDNLDNVYQVTSDRTFVPGLSRFNYAPWHFIQRPNERYTAGGFASFDFSKALQAYAEVMAMKDRTSWQVGPSGNFRNTETINCDNPLLSDQQKSLICRTGNFVSEINGAPTPFFDPVTGATYSRA
jgi:iron complex outermembrane recepter protein